MPLVLCIWRVTAITAAAILLLLASPTVAIDTAYTTVHPACLPGSLSLTYVGPFERSSDWEVVSAPHSSEIETGLIIDNQIQTGFNIADETTGAKFSGTYSFIASTELSSEFRIDLVPSSSVDPVPAECTFASNSNLLEHTQLLITTEVEDATSIDSITITAFEQDDTSGTIIPIVSWSPSTHTPLTLPYAATNKFKMAYACTADTPGNVVIFLHVSLILADPSTGLLNQVVTHTVKVTKDCAPTSCDGLCHHGTCNPVTARCECEANYNQDPYCSYSFGFENNVTEACSMEPLTLTYDTTIIRGDASDAINDWFNVMSPSTTCPGCPWSSTLVRDEYWIGFQPEWFYLSTQSNLYGTTPKLSNTFTLVMRDDLPGDWAFVYFMADSSTAILSIATVKQLPRDHPRCIALAETRRLELAAQTVELHTQIRTLATSSSSSSTSFWAPTLIDGSLPIVLSSESSLTASEVAAVQQCIHGSFDESTGACVCPDGYWGFLCEYGCSKGTPIVINSFGTEFGSTVAGLSPAYVNYAECAWLIRLPSPANGFRISFPTLSTETSDFVSVTAGNASTPLDSDGLPDTSLFTSVTKLAGLYSHGTSEFVVNSATYAYVTFHSDLSHASETWNSYTGMSVVFHALGCPAGSIVQNGVTIATDMESFPLATVKQYRCVPCEPGTVNPTVDLHGSTCTPCSPGTYAPSSGMTECIPVARGYFQRAAGATTMESCSDAGWPAECVDSPYPTSSRFGVFIAFLALVLLCLFIVIGIIIRFREQRILFHASPQFMLGALGAAVMFTIGLILHALPQTSELCNAKLYLLYPAPSILLGCLLVRQWRLHRIFNNIVLTMVKLPVWKLWSTVGALVAVDFIALIVLTAIDPYEVTSDEYPTCHSSQETAGFNILCALMAMKAALCVGLLYVCWRTRGIPENYNETKPMSLASLNILLVAVILIASTYDPSVDTTASSGTIVTTELSLCIYAVASTITFLFGTKLLHLFQNLFTGKDRLDGESTNTKHATVLVSKAGAAPSSLGAVNGAVSSAINPPAPAGHRKYLRASGGPLAGRPPPSTTGSSPATGTGTGTGIITIDAKSVAIWPAPPSTDLQPSNGDIQAVPHLPGSTEEDTQSGPMSPASPSNGGGGGGARYVYVGRKDSHSSSEVASAAHPPTPPLSGAGGGGIANAGATSTVRARHAAVRREINVLQLEVTRLKSQLMTKERLLAKANNLCMTLAFEINENEQ